MEGGPAAGPTRDTPPFPVDEALVNTAWVEVPPTIGSILRSAPEDASAWRRRTRAQFQEHLEDDYAVTGFTWRENPQPDAGGDAGAHTLLNRRYYYRLEKLEGTETQ